MAKVWICQSAFSSIQSYSKNTRTEISDVINLLEQDIYRNQNKIDYDDTIDECKVYGLITHGISLSFHENNKGEVCVDFVTLYSKFRSP